MIQAQQEPPSRERDTRREERERRRFEVLRGVYERSTSVGANPVRALDIGLAIGLSREEVFRTVLDLTQGRYLSFCAAGPQVSITERGIAYLQRGAGKRRSVR